MLSSKYKFIFLHVPKTGGNSVQTRLLPLSEDRQITNISQDGVHRFGIAGPVTPRKHAVLAEYADILGANLKSFATIISYRPPFERMVSLFFSGHRWKQSEPIWNHDKFIDLVRETPTTADFLRVGGQIIQPDFVLRFRHLQADFLSLTKALSLPLTDTALPIRNPSAATPEMMKAVLSDSDLRDVVDEIMSEDLELQNLAEPEATET